jgi:hypothetical protein
LTVGILPKVALTSNVPPLTLSDCTLATVKVEVCTVPEATTNALVPGPPVIVVVPLQPLRVKVSLHGPPVNRAVLTLSSSMVSVPVTLFPLIVRLESLSVSFASALTSIVFVPPGAASKVMPPEGTGSPLL